MNACVKGTLYQRYAYENGFIVYQTFVGGFVGGSGFDWPMVFSHAEIPTAFLATSTKYWNLDAIRSERFTGNCGIRTLEFANTHTTALLVERAVLWMRYYNRLAMIVASDWVDGYTARVVTGWRKTRGIPNPNMGPISNDDDGHTHDIRLFWKDVHDLDTSEIDTWKAVPIPQPTAIPSLQPGIFAGTSGLTTAT